MDNKRTNDATSSPNVIVGVTGASGAAYARRLISMLCQSGCTVHMVVTPYGRQLFRDELGIEQVNAKSLIGQACPLLIPYNYRDVGAKIASGSFKTGGMVVCPCSGNSLAAMATGLQGNLLERAAAVTLKEARRLIVVPREMPMSRIELENCLRLHDAGAVICPASPGFYMLPQTVDDLVDFVVGKILDLLDVTHSLNTRWETQLQNPSLPTEP